MNAIKVISLERLITSRNNALFISTEDLARRANLDKSDLSALAAADALSSLAGHRREALWDTLAVDERTRLDMPAVPCAPPPLKEPPPGPPTVPHSRRPAAT